MIGFPKYSLDALEARREILGIKGGVIVVEGISDVKLYKRLKSNKREIFSVSGFVGHTDNNRDEVVSMAEEYPNNYFIVDDDLTSIYLPDYQNNLPENLATTWKYSDIECWAFKVLNKFNRISEIGLTKEDIDISFELSKEIGIMRLIQRKMEIQDPETRFKIDIKKVRKEIISQNVIIGSKFKIVDFVIKQQTRNPVGIERWKKKIISNKRIFSDKEDLQLIVGHDLTFFLYCLSAKKKKVDLSLSNYNRFEKDLMYKSCKSRKHWEDFLSGKIGSFLTTN